MCLYYVTLPSGQDRERNDFTLFERSPTEVKEQKKKKKLYEYFEFKCPYAYITVTLSQEGNGIES